MKNKSNPHDYIVWWLFITAGFVMAMVIIGGITRLTGSGLSMVEWRVLMGTLPPLHETEWQRVFSLYQSSPEFKYIHSDMELAGFKVIFFWEYIHRLWGRLIGLVFVLPFIVFAIKGLIAKAYYLPLFGLLCLGGLQGGIGWWMVQSGLIDNPTVSHYRLACHLGLALVIYGLLIWTGLSIQFQNLYKPSGFALFTLSLLSLTIIAGAFVAGSDAGLVYNQYPFMGDGLIPIEYGEMGILDPFENPASIQFHHRWLAAFSLLILFLFAYRLNRGGYALIAYSIYVLVSVQFMLGIITLLMGVPIWAGILHQIGALFLLTSVILGCFFDGKMP